MTKYSYEYHAAELTKSELFNQLALVGIIRFWSLSAEVKNWLADKIAVSSPLIFLLSGKAVCMFSEFKVALLNFGDSLWVKSKTLAQDEITKKH